MRPASSIKILCAPDSFKESISALEAAEAMAAGVRDAGEQFQPDVCPIADGGEGTLEALIGALGGTIESATVTGLLGEPVAARFGMTADGKTAIVELAQASGLALVPKDRRDPMRTTTFGTGELIRLAAERGCELVIVCLGGSATVDGATGIAQALGARFFDRGDQEITEPMRGGLLRSVSRIERPLRGALPHLRIACDVTNPLCGRTGAAAVYGPQKGATPQQVQELDAGLAHIARLLGANPATPGFGSAGGASFGLVTMLGAELERGIDLVLEAIRFDERCRDAALVLTGEGRLDEQSLSGKASMGVAKRARQRGVPSIAIVGSTGDGAERCTDPAHGGELAGYVSLADRFGMERALVEPAALIRQVAAEIVRELAGEESIADKRK
jgi:glycerate 2-kinase